MSRTEQPKPVSSVQARCINVTSALVLLLIVVMITHAAVRDDPLGSREHPSTTTNDNMQESSKLALSPVRVRLCSIIRRIDALGASSGRAQSTSTSPELFEFLGLDPTKPPFHPSCAMALPKMPPRKTCHDAIQAAWLSKLDDISFGACTGSGVDTSGGDAGTRKDDAIVLIRERVLVDDTRHRLDVEGECTELGRLVHAVAGALWNDQSRADYVRNLLPVLRPRTGSAFSWGSAGTRSLDTVCPE